jgi:hypothetical protein
MAIILTMHIPSLLTTAFAVQTCKYNTMDHRCERFYVLRLVKVLLLLMEQNRTTLKGLSGGRKKTEAQLIDSAKTLSAIFLRAGGFHADLTNAHQHTDKIIILPLLDIYVAMKCTHTHLAASVLSLRRSYNT